MLREPAGLEVAVVGVHDWVGSVVMAGSFVGSECESTALSFLSVDLAAPLVKSSALDSFPCSRNPATLRRMTATAAPTARARARAELTEEIKAVARRQLAEQGSAALSLRAVAREVGMVSSAVYRYFPSRDDLLTALIVDAYDAVGDAAEQALAAHASARASWPGGSP